MSYIPTWIYILFFLLLYLGIKRCSTRVISMERIALVPAVFVFLSARSTMHLFHFSPIGFLLLLMGGVGGFAIGYRFIRNQVIRVDKEKHLIEVPGDTSMLAMVMIIFFIEFFIHYAVDAHWSVADWTLFKNGAVILSGVVLGISIGRTVTYFLKYLNTESVNLRKQN